MSGKIKKEAYIIITPSGRSIISIRNDPNKALFKTKKEAMKWLKIRQSSQNVKLKIKKIKILKTLFEKIF